MGVWDARLNSHGWLEAAGKVGNQDELFQGSRVGENSGESRKPQKLMKSKQAPTRELW